MPTDSPHLGSAGGIAHPPSSVVAPLTRFLLAVFVFVAGMAAALQSRANGTLAVEMGVPVYAALWSFLSGLVILTCGFMMSSERRAAKRLLRAFRGGELRWWQFAGGLVGGAFVGVQTFAVPVAGVALFLVSVVAGQSVGGLVVERFGIGGSPRQTLTWSRVGWALLTVGGAAFAMSGRVGASSSDTLVVLLPILASVGIGSLVAVQTALNGQVRAVGGSFWVATWGNFMWGSGLLLGILAAQWAWAPAGLTPIQEWSGAPWWSYLGGAMGIVIVVAGAVSVRALGVLTVMLLMISGQLLGALALDVADPTTRHLVTFTLVTGVFITLGAAIGSVWRPRRRAL